MTTVTSSVQLTSCDCRFVQRPCGNLAHACRYRMNGVRHSQKPIFFRINGGGWSITSSVDADSPPPHIGYQKNWPSRSESSLNSVRPCMEHSSFVLTPIEATSPVLPRPPLRGGGGGKDDDELARLRKKLAHAERTVALQQQVIEQLCHLRVHVEVTTTAA